MEYVIPEIQCGDVVHILSKGWGRVMALGGSTVNVRMAAGEWEYLDVPRRAVELIGAPFGQLGISQPEKVWRRNCSYAEGCMYRDRHGTCQSTVWCTWFEPAPTPDNNKPEEPPAPGPLLTFEDYDGIEKAWMAARWTSRGLGMVARLNAAYAAKFAAWLDALAKDIETKGTLELFPRAGACHFLAAELRRMGDVK